MRRRKVFTESIFTISNVLSADECQELIAFAEQRGFEVATIEAREGPRLDREMRNNDRVIVDDIDRANRLWSRVARFMPRTRDGRQVLGLNERIRYYRYNPGQRFSWHYDGSFERNNGEASLLTFMIYLNDGYEGGNTRFEELEVAGKLGMALVFEHELLHEGAELKKGIKYVLRSDVMYGPLSKGHAAR
jgi:hypothetical protein